MTAGDTTALDELHAKAQQKLWKGVLVFVLIGLVIGLGIAAARGGGRKNYALSAVVGALVAAGAAWGWNKHGPAGFGG